MSFFNKEDDTYVMLIHGYPNFNCIDHLEARSNYLADLPYQFLLACGYIKISETDKIEALHKCISVSEEQLFQELTEFYRIYYSS